MKALSATERRRKINARHCRISIRRQCKLLGLSRSSYYYRPRFRPRTLKNRLLPVLETKKNLRLMKRIDELYMAYPFYGTRNMTVILNREGYRVNRKRIQRLMRLMGIQAIYPKPRLSIGGKDHKIYPYLLKNLTINRADQVWCADISVLQKAAEEMRVWPLAIGLQEQVANHHKRLGSKAPVVSVAEKVPEGIRCGSRRQTTVNCRSSVESAQMTSKPGPDVNPGSAWRVPAYWPCGVRHRGSASLILALLWNCRNLRLRCQGKGASQSGEADSTDAQPRGGVTRSSFDAAVTAVERRGHVIGSWKQVNRERGRNLYS